MTTYKLSNRQRKEYENAKVLRIAMPHPDESVDDLERWARKHCDIPPDAIVFATEVVLIHVNPLQKDGGGVGNILGSIIRENASLVWSIPVECIVVEFSRRHTGRARYPDQWPGKVVLPDGRILPDTM